MAQRLYSRPKAIFFPVNQEEEEEKEVEENEEEERKRKGGEGDSQLQCSLLRQCNRAVLVANAIVSFQ